MMLTLMERRTFSSTLEMCAMLFFLHHINIVDFVILVCGIRKLAVTNDNENDFDYTNCRMMHLEYIIHYWLIIISSLRMKLSNIKWFIHVLFYTLFKTQWLHQSLDVVEICIFLKNSYDTYDI